MEFGIWGALHGFDSLSITDVRSDLIESIWIRKQAHLQKFARIAYDSHLTMFVWDGFICLISHQSWNTLLFWNDRVHLQ
jgi:hypothetical protein